MPEMNMAKHTISFEPRNKAPTLFAIPPLEDTVTVYHDETAEACGKRIWGHGLLFVPERSKESLLKDLQDARIETDYHGKLRFAKISESVYTPKYNCAKRWVQIGVEYLKREKGCKLGIIFFDKESANIGFYSGDTKEKILKLVETVLRMVLKGSVHYLYNENWRIKVHGIITDGEPWHRGLDDLRILDVLLSGVRDYVEILPFAGISAVFSNHNDSRCNDTDSAHILQLTDLLLGSTIQSCFRELECGKKKEIIVRPVKEMLDKRKRGKNFKYSSHYRSFTLTSASVVKDAWQFEPLNTKEIIINDEKQLTIL